MRTIFLLKSDLWIVQVLDEMVKFCDAVGSEAGSDTDDAGGSEAGSGTDDDWGTEESYVLRRTL